MICRLPVTIASALVFPLFLAWAAPPSAQGKKEVPAGKQAWTLDEALAQLRLHPKDPYLQFVVLQLARRDGNFQDVSEKVERIVNGNPWSGRNGRRNDVDLFSIMTGALAVQESLQLDTMRGQRPGQPRRDRGGDDNFDATAAKWEKRRKEIVKVADLQGPTIRSHPWDTMLAGRKPEIDPLARMVPDDFYFIQFRSIAKLLDTVENSDLWATHLFNQALREARTSNIGDRLKQQLALETTPLARPFYDLVVDEVAITGSDLFIREGSDVTLIFRFKQPAIFKARMDGFLTNAEKAHADAKRTPGEHAGVSYVQLATPNRDLHVLSAYPAENVHVRSNSKAALLRVLEAMRGKDAHGKAVTRLGDTSEFAYIRTIYPRGAAEEDGLIYLSDPFIRRLVGPQVKLTERRRMLCYNHLRMIGNSAMLYRTEHGKAADSLETLLDARCCLQPFHTPKSSVDAKKLAALIADLDSNQFAVRQKASEELTKLATSAEAELRKVLEQKPPLEVVRRIEELLLKVDRLCICPSGGAYLLGADGQTGVCTHHGHAQFLTPNLELPTAVVRGDEADEYKTFLTEYNQYWRTFFDPIALRIQATPERYRLETIVLPLLDNSIYTGMAASMGGKPVDLDALPVPKRNIFSLGLHINKKPLVEQLENLKPHGFLRGLLGGDHPEANNLDFVKLFRDGIGDQVGLHVYDSVPLIDLNLSEMLGMTMGSFNGSSRGVDPNMVLGAFAAASLTSPVYLSIPVQSIPVVDGFGDQLEKVFAAVAREGDRGRFLQFGSDFYQVPFKGDKTQMMRSFVVKVGPIKLRYFWARIGNTLYIASKDFILEDILALEKGPRATPPAAAGETMAHAMVRVRPKNWNQVLADYRLGWAENHREACLNNHGPLSSVARSMTTSLGKIDAKELDTIAGRVRQQADQLYQVHFFCPEGGRYVLGPDGKAMTCSVHGSTLAPRQMNAPSDTSPLGKQLERFSGMTATLTFREEGLQAVIVLDRK